MDPKLEWDEAKAAQNHAQRGLHFTMAGQFNWSTAQTRLDDRQDYAEDRFISRGMIGDRLHTLIYTLRGDSLRIISLRKSNRREQIAYAAETGRPIGNP